MDERTGEQWRDIPSFPNYRVSDLGRVWSKPRISNGKIRKKVAGKFLTVHVGSNGYPRTGLMNEDAQQVVVTVHSLIALAFLGPRPEGQQVRHLNGNHEDCRLDNLAYGTPAENAQDTLQHGMNPQVKKTHCPYGHEYTEDNIYRQPSKPRARICRACIKARVRVRK